MLLSTIASVFSAFLFAQSTLAAPSLTGPEIVINIGTVTSLSMTTTDQISKLNERATLEIVKASSKALVTNFETIIQTIQADIVAMAATAPLPGDPAVTDPIVEALVEFVRVHQLLLNVVIGKHGILAQFGVTVPIAAVLRNLEAIIDSFAFSLIRLIPNRRTDVTRYKNDLDVSVRTTITVMVQICIPSIIYPRIQPICIPGLG